MSDLNSHTEDHLTPITEGGQSVDAIEHGAQTLDHDDSCSVMRDPNESLDDISAGAGDGDTSSGRSEALGKGISALLEGVIKDFDSIAVDTSGSQDQLSSALDRLTRELDQLLEDAPVPFIMQHASRISGVRKRVKSLIIVLRPIQRRIDNVDRTLTVGLAHGHGKLSKGSKPP